MRAKTTTDLTKRTMQDTLYFASHGEGGEAPVSIQEMYKSCKWQATSGHKSKPNSVTTSATKVKIPPKIKPKELISTNHYLKKVVQAQ